MATHDRTYSGGENSNAERTPVGQFCIDFDMPQKLGNKLIGKTEQETEENLTEMKNYLRFVVEQALNRAMGG